MAKFAENAKKLREQQEREARGAEALVHEPGTGSDNFVDSSADLNAKVYADTRIIPEIDSLANRHTSGEIPRSEVENTFKKIMNQMVTDGVMTKEQMDQYLEPTKIKEEVQVERGSGALDRVAKAFGSKTTKETIIKNGPSQFEKDMEKVFGKEDPIKSPNIASTKDKLLQGISEICTKLGFDGLARSCKKHMSVDNQERLNKLESGMVDMTQKVTAQAKEIGAQVGNKAKGERIAEQTQSIVAKRQKNESSMSR